MPSGTCSHRAGFADTIRLLASLIVLGCSIAGRTAENEFATTKTGSRTPSACAQRARPRNARCSALLWHGNGRPRHSVAACRVSQFGRCIGAGILRRVGCRRGRARKTHDAQRVGAGRARSPLPLVFRRSISARLVSDELREPSIRCLGRALERLEVDVDHAEAAAVAFRPLEVIDERPDEITAQFYTGGERAAGGSEVLAQIGDAIVVV